MIRVAASRLPVRLILEVSANPQLLTCFAISTKSAQTHNTPTVETIQVTPKVTLFDENVHIRVTGLRSNSKVTLRLSTDQEWRQQTAQFVSYSHHVSSSAGDVDLKHNPSVGGTYTGLDSMGLFWSMIANPDCAPQPRLVVKNIDDPIYYHLSVYDGHFSLKDFRAKGATLQPVSTAVITRLKKKGTVKRVIVRDGNLRGVLFLPEWGAGPHPGVIDLQGSVGGIMEVRAALLASHGFTAFCLPYYLYEDLPAKIEHVDFKYFQEAAKWMNNHKLVKKGGIGVVGISKGAEYAIIMGWKCPEVAAVVQINGPPFYTTYDLKMHGQTMLKGIPFQLERAHITEDGMNIRHCFPHSQDSLIPVWEGCAHLLTIVADDDEQNEPCYERELYNRYPDCRRHLMEVVHYPGAGHLLEPPYTPFCRCCYNPALNINMIWGGRLKDHAKAQMEAWQRTLAFLKKHLVYNTV